MNWTIIAYAIVFCILFLLTSYVFFTRIYNMFILKTEDPDFELLLTALNAAINTEIELWERDIFVNKKAMTNSNFENFYYEISNHIINSLSESFYIRFEHYLTRDAVYSIISRKVKEYLTEKTKTDI